MIVSPSAPTGNTCSTDSTDKHQQIVDSDGQVPTLLGVLGEYAGKGDHFLRVVCPGCGRTCGHGWNIKKYPLRPQHRYSLCGCLPNGYLVIPDVAPFEGGAK